MRPSRDSRLTRFVLIAFFILAALYAVFEIRGQILGPSIILDTIPPYTNTSFIHIKGQAQRMSSLSMDGGEISVTENGSFDEPYVLAPGENRIVLEAKDAYGHTSTYVIDIVYLAPFGATTTVSSVGTIPPPAPPQPDTTPQTSPTTGTTTVEVPVESPSTTTTQSPSSTQPVAPVQ